MSNNEIVQKLWNLCDILRDDLGDLYESLLEKNATETKSGAGQYFTPRPLIDSIVALIRPQPGETVQDPAAGTAGFLIAADAYIKARTDNLYDLSEKQHSFQRSQAFLGMELVPGTQRLALMNCLLHGMEGDEQGVIHLGNTLGDAGKRLPKSDIILSNPPFGTAKGGGGPTRDDLTHSTSNKQLAFLQHIVRHLKDGGRAAVVLPDNVLFEAGVGADIRRDLMDKCNLHTILRLPTGIFYVQGVKTNVLFFSKAGQHATGTTKNVWVYDLRANMPRFGKRTPLTREHFREFEAAYGDDPLGQSLREDQGESGRFRCFSREWIGERGDSLDIAWLKDDSTEDAATLPEPAVLAQEAVGELEGALAKLQAILRELGESGGRKKSRARTPAPDNGSCPRAVRIPADLAFERSDIELEIERIGDETRIRPTRRSLSGVLAKFASFAPETLAEGRGDQEQAERAPL